MQGGGGVAVGVAVAVAVAVALAVAVAVAVGVGDAVAVAVADAVAVAVGVGDGTGVAVAVAVGVGVGDGPPVTSSAPMSGAVGLRGSLSKSFVTAASGVAIFATGDVSELKCRSTVVALPFGATSCGSTETECASRPVAVCQLERVGSSVLARRPTNPPVPLANRSLKSEVAPAVAESEMV